VMFRQRITGCLEIGRSPMTEDGEGARIHEMGEFFATRSHRGYRPDWGGADVVHDLSCLARQSA